MASNLNHPVQLFFFFQIMLTQFLYTSMVCVFSWKREQQLAGNGMVFNNNNLETIQEWCEHLAELIWLNRQQIKEVELLRQRLPLDQSAEPLTQLLADITQLLSSLVTSTFIIEKQPPQVMKTNTRY